MSDKLELEITSRNSTAKGWHDVEREAKSRGDRIRQITNDMWAGPAGNRGNSGEGKAGNDRSGSGKGFMEVFGKAFRGDISGALEELQERMGKGMKSLTAKASVWGAGVATAFVAGFKAGGALDEMLGISDKIAAAWSGPKDSGKLGVPISAKRKARQDAEKEEFDAKSGAEFESKRSDIVDSRNAMDGGAQGKFELETKRMLELQSKTLEVGISIEEQRKRILEYEKQITAVKEAGIAVDQEEAAAASAIAQTDERVRTQVENDLAAAKKKSAEDSEAFLDDMHKQQKAEEKDAIQAQIDGLEKAQDKEKAAFEVKRNQLLELAKLKALGEQQLGVAADPRAFKAQGDKDKDDARNKKHQQFLIDQAKGMLDRGIKLPPRFQAALDADANINVGAAAKKAADLLERQFRAKQLKQADDIAQMQKDMALLVPSLQNLKAFLTMSG